MKASTAFRVGVAQRTARNDLDPAFLAARTLVENCAKSIMPVKGKQISSVVKIRKQSSISIEVAVIDSTQA